MHQANLEDSRETLNALLHHGPSACGAIARDVAIAAAAVRALAPQAMVRPRPSMLAPAPGPWERAPPHRLQQMVDSVQRHGEYSARATGLLVRASLSSFATAAASLSQRSSSGTAPQERAAECGEADEHMSAAHSAPAALTREAA